MRGTHMTLEVLSGLVEPLDTDERVELLRHYQDLVFDHLSTDSIAWFRHFDLPDATWVRWVTKRSRHGFTPTAVRLVMGWLRLGHPDQTPVVPALAFQQRSVRPVMTSRALAFHVSAFDTTPGRWIVSAHVPFTSTRLDSRPVSRLSDAPAAVEKLALLARYKAEKFTKHTGAPWYDGRNR